MEVHHERRPQSRELFHVQRRAVKEVQERVIAHGLKPQRPHEAGEAPQVLAHAQPHQDYAIHRNVLFRAQAPRNGAHHRHHPYHGRMTTSSFRA